jgi:hypothetical protein
MLQRRFQVFGNFPCKYSRLGSVVAVFKRFVFMLEDVEVGFVAFGELRMAHFVK